MCNCLPQGQYNRGNLLRFECGVWHVERREKEKERGLLWQGEAIAETGNAQN